jgi:TRAP-type uncharacterized transport system fused permease subunit
MALETLAAGNLILGLLMAAVISIILGMGVSPVLVYLISYVFVIPVLVGLGAPVMSTHLFVLIFGAVANITPPVCVAAYTAATIARAPTMRTGFAAAKLGFAAYIVAFMLVLHPALLLLGGSSITEAALAIVTAGLGITAMSASFEGWLLGRASILQRLLLFGGGVLLISPWLELGGIGAGLLALTIFWQKFRPGHVK